MARHHQQNQKIRRRGPLRINLQKQTGSKTQQQDKTNKPLALACFQHRNGPQQEGACLLFVLDPEFASCLVATASRLPESVASISMFNMFMVSTLGSSWAQQQELVPGDPATGPPYYSGGAETGNQRTNEPTTFRCFYAYHSWSSLVGYVIVHGHNPILYQYFDSYVLCTHMWRYY